MWILRTLTLPSLCTARSGEWAVVNFEDFLKIVFLLDPLCMVFKAPELDTEVFKA